MAGTLLRTLPGEHRSEQSPLHTRSARQFGKRIFIELMTSDSQLKQGVQIWRKIPSWIPPEPTPIRRWLHSVCFSAGETGGDWLACAEGDGVVRILDGEGEEEEVSFLPTPPHSRHPGGPHPVSVGSVQEVGTPHLASILVHIPMVDRASALTSPSAFRCRANSVRIRQSGPNLGPGFRVKHLETFQVVPSSLGKGP